MHELLQAPPGTPTWQHRALLVPLFAVSTCDSRSLTELRIYLWRRPWCCQQGCSKRKESSVVVTSPQYHRKHLQEGQNRTGILSDRVLTESIAEIQNFCFKLAVKKSCVGLSNLLPQLLPWRNTVFAYSCLTSFPCCAFGVSCTACSPSPLTSLLLCGDVYLPVWSVFFRCSLQTRRGWKKH